jgi:hypothetical protein
VWAEVEVVGERGNWKRKWEVVGKSGGISRSGYGSITGT